MNISNQNAPMMEAIVLSAEPLCAWCLAEQGLPMGERSHGICKKHANKLLLDWKAMKELERKNAGLH